MLEKSQLIPIIETTVLVGTDVSDPKSTKKIVDDNGKQTRPVERFIVRGWSTQLERAKKEYSACASTAAFFVSLEKLTCGAWGHYDSESLAVYAENESIARSYVAIAFDLMVRGLVVSNFLPPQKTDEHKKG
jgi:hypothetical protein